MVQTGSGARMTSRKILIGDIVEWTGQTMDGKRHRYRVLVLGFSGDPHYPYDCYYFSDRQRKNCHMSNDGVDRKVLASLDGITGPVLLEQVLGDLP